MRRILLHVLLVALALLCVRPCKADVAATYNSAADVPVTASSFSAAGATFSATLNFAPTAGTNLTVVKNTGLGFINGTFSNMAQGQVMTLSYGGINYRFIANYYGGSGNDLVLQWAKARPVAWGENFNGQIGDNSATDRLTPVDVLSTGVLTGKTVVALAAGYLHSLAVCSDGTVAAWGYNFEGELGNNSALGFSGVPVLVSTAGVLSGKTVVAVAAGDNHSLALCSDGTVAAWGYNAYGQLGNNSTTNSNVPVAVTTAGALAGKTVVAVAAGGYSSLALCSDGTMVAWGSGSSSQFGNSSVPTAVEASGALSGKIVVAVTAGSGHSLALCSDGTVAAWGSNSSGQLGNNSTTDSSVAVAVNTSGALLGKTVVAVVAGRRHSLALCSDGTLAAWGNNSDGQLGNNSTTNSSAPVAVNASGALAGKTVVAVVGGDAHSVARCSDGTLAAWGMNGSGQLGNNTTFNSSVPVAVSSSPLASGESYAAAFCGSYADHSLGLVASPYFPLVTSLAATNLTKTSATLNGSVKPDGSAATAYFEYGLDTGYGSSANVTLSPNDGLSAQNVNANLTSLTPGATYHYRLTAVNAASTVSTVDSTFTTSINVAAIYDSASDAPVTANSFSAGGATFSAMLNFAPPTGASLTVVKNTGSSFINGTFNNLAQGQVVTLSYGGINYRFIANYYGGSGNDLVLQWANTRPITWGNNGSGQLGDNSTTNRLVPVDVFSTGVFVGKTITSSAAGNRQSLALCSDGTVAAWGDNFYGELGNGGTTNSSVPVAVNTAGALSGKAVVAVAAGRSHSLALCSDGTVATWGDNSYGQLGNGGTTNSSVPVVVNTTGILGGRTVVAVAANWSHSLALCSDGTIAAWGNNASGQLGNGSTTSSNVPVAVNTAGLLAGKAVITLAAGGVLSLALCSDGTVVTWGGSGSAPMVVSRTGTLAGKTVTAVASGDFHSLALCSDGTVAAWGSNDNGQLGNGSTTDSTVPVAVDASGVLAGKSVVAITAGKEHSVARCSDGTLAIWGYNFYGQLGNNSTTDNSVPVAVSSNPLASGERYAAIFCGSYAWHNTGLIALPPFPVVTRLAATNLTPISATLNGTVNPNGSAATAYFEYGLDTSYGSSVSMALSPNDGLSAQNVSASLSGLMPGATYHYRLTATNAVSTVSTTDGTFTTSINVAATYNSAADVPVTAGSVLVEGGTFSATLNFAPPTGTTLTVVKNTGLGFINGKFSNLAQGQVVTLSYGGISYRFIANYYGGSGNDLVLQWADTRPMAWGNNGSGQLGDNSTTNRLVPVNVFSTGVLAGQTVISAAAGSFHSLALCSDGTLAAWGFNSSGQLGDNSTTNRLVPVTVFSTGVLSGKMVVAVAAGSSHSLALCSDGTVAAWGLNSSGQLGNNSITQSTVAVAVNVAGVLSGKSVVEMAAGSSHSLALCSDGTVAAWGLNSSGQLGNNSTTQSKVPVAVNAAGVLAGKRVVAVAAGDAHSLALCSDGTLAAWGRNSSGQLGDNSTTSRLVPVKVFSTGVLAGKTVISAAAGASHNLVLCSDGTVAAWGDNFYGQLGNNSTTNRTVPVAISTTGVLSSKTVVTVGAGLSHTLARCSDSTFAAWGRNISGQLGNNSTNDSLVPVAVSSSPLAIGESYAAAFNGSTVSSNLGLIASPPAPAVATLTATSLISGSVTLNGAVNAASGSATVSFDYGMDNSYGSTVTGTPSPVTGSTDAITSATIVSLAPNTTYHYRVRATNAGGTTSGADVTFTTPQDTTGPIGGTMTVTPASPVGASAALTVAFANWTDSSMPLTYAVLIDDVVVSAQGASASRDITGPATAGAHTLKGRIYDALGYFTEVTQNFTVITTQGEWRTFYFGTAQNLGDAADVADPDGDGTNNVFEYVAGLVPTSALSRFSVRVETVAGQMGQMAIVFKPLAAGRTYKVKYKTSVTDATWTPLTDLTTSDNGTERTITDLSAGSGPRFYQVEITLP